MFFLELLRLVNNRNRAAGSDTTPPQSRTKLRFKLPQLPPSVTDRRVYKLLSQRWHKIAAPMSSFFDATDTRNAERMADYTTPSGKNWPPYQPTGRLAIEIHKLAAVQIYSYLILPYSLVTSILATIAVIVINIGLPHFKYYSLFLAILGWLPSAMLSGMYWYASNKIDSKRDESWAQWSKLVNKRLKEFEGLNGVDRLAEEGRFRNWVIMGETDEAWYLDELTLDDISNYDDSDADGESVLHFVSNTNIPLPDPELAQNYLQMNRFSRWMELRRSPDFRDYRRHMDRQRRNFEMEREREQHLDPHRNWGGPLERWRRANASEISADVWWDRYTERLRNGDPRL